jgi:Methylamine utilisation protein MauE
MRSQSSDVNQKRHVSLLSRLAFGGERLIAWTLAVMLIRSALIHLSNPYSFLSTVYSYQMTGITVGKWTALVLPYLQMVVAACLVTRGWLKEAYYLAAGMFLMFLTAQMFALKQGLEISCGCFGPSESLQVGPATLTLASSAAFASLLGCRLTVLGQRQTSTVPS